MLSCLCLHSSLQSLLGTIYIWRMHWGGGGTGRNLTNGRVGSVDLVLTGNFLQTPFVYAPLKPKTDHAWNGLDERLGVAKQKPWEIVAWKSYLLSLTSFDISSIRRIARNKYLWPCTWKYRRLPCWWNGVRPNLCLRPGLSRASSNGTATLRTTNVSRDSRESWNQPTRASERERHPHTSHPVIKNRFYSKRVSSKVQSLSDEIHQGNSEP